MPRCAGECRFVRVARVLDASWTRTCVALVLAAAAPVSRRACPGPGAVTPAREPARGCQRRPFFTRCRQPPEDRLPPATRWPASHPVTPSARPGMTHREEQSMRRRIKSTHIADSLLVTQRLPGSPSAPRSAISVSSSYGWLMAGSAGHWVVRTRLRGRSADPGDGCGRPSGEAHHRKPRRRAGTAPSRGNGR